jgi:hypothetical protein
MTARRHLGAECRGFPDVPALLALILSEFDDQDAVLRRHRDQHYQADLGIKIERQLEDKDS